MARRAAALLAVLLATAPWSAPAQPDWTRLLPEIAPALRACLEGQAGAMVVSAWPMNHGLVGARLRLAGGTRQDCAAASNGARVALRRPVAQGDRRPGEGERAFMLDRHCADAQRVRGPDGTILGWLAYPSCG